MWNAITQFFNERFYRLLVLVLPPTPKPLPKNPKLILVFSTTGIGDALFDSAAIKSLKQGYPQAKLLVCAHHRRQSVAKHNPFVDEVIPLSKSPLSQLCLLRRFWKKRPELVVALHVNEEAVPLGYLLNRHAFVGSLERCQRFAFLLSHPVMTRDEPHIVEETLKVAIVAGGATVGRGMVYQVSEEEMKALHCRYPENLLSQSTAAANSFVAPVLEASSINYTLSACAPSAPSSSSAAATLKTGSALLQKPYVVFQTGGGATLAWRNWPVDSYVQAIQWMQERYPHQIVLTGGHDNEAAGTAIAAACPRVLNLVQKTTLEETAALLRGAAMLVSTDTGVMHLGFAIGCPTLAFLHYRSPASMYGPLDYSPGHEIVELPQPSAETSVEARVSAEERPGNEMKQISFEKVTSAMERILEKKQN